MARFRLPTSEFPLPCWRRLRRGPPRTSPRFGAKAFRCRGSAGTNTTAAMRWSFPVLRGRPAPRGSPHAVPCAPERDWSRLQARVKRWPSMLRQTLPSWCGQVDGPDELTAVPGGSRLNALAIGPGIGVGEATCELGLAGLRGRARRRARRRCHHELFRRSATACGGASGRRGRATILTPHEGEFSVTSGLWTHEQKLDRSSNGRALPRRSAVPS